MPPWLCCACTAAGLNLESEEKKTYSELDFASSRFPHAICRCHGPLFLGAIGQCRFVFYDLDLSKYGVLFSESR
jgi:hypothetical protein